MLINWDSIGFYYIEPSVIDTTVLAIMFQPSMSLNLEEKTRLEKMIAGDNSAFEEILSIYEKPIFNHLLRLTKNRDDASDLMQETFFRLYNKRSQVNIADNFKNWLYKVATNIAYDYFRKKKREKLVSLDGEETFETNEPELSYSTLEEEISRIDLDQALGEISLSHRNILLLYYREGFSYEEISEILNLPINTTKTNLRRARQELGKFLKNTYG